MYSRNTSNFYLGLFCLAFALFLIFIWIPLDTDTGLVDKIRRRLVIGDALAPTIAAVFLAIGGLVLIIFERRVPSQPYMTGQNLRFISVTSFLLIISLILMRYTGPLAVWIANLSGGEPLEYRLLRDTPPWKYIGYFIGGTVMITGLIAQVESVLSWRTLRIAVLAAILLIVIYDLPFDDLLLPPNGDV